MAKQNLWIIRIKNNPKADTYTLQYEEDSYNWDNVQIDPVKN